MKFLRLKQDSVIDSFWFNRVYFVVYAPIRSHCPAFGTLDLATSLGNLPGSLSRFFYVTFLIFLCLLFYFKSVVLWILRGNINWYPVAIVYSEQTNTAFVCGKPVCRSVDLSCPWKRIFVVTAYLVSVILKSVSNLGYITSLSVTKYWGLVKFCDTFSMIFLKNNC